MDDGNGHRILARNWTTGILRHHDGEEPEWETLPKKIIWNKKRSTRARSSFFDEKMKKKKKRTKIGEAEELKTSRGGGMPETNLSGVTQEGSEESSQTNWAAGHILNASKSIEKKENGGKKKQRDTQENKVIQLNEIVTRTQPRKRTTKIVRLVFYIILCDCFLFCFVFLNCFGWSTTVIDIY
jgi:hypothetical protein